MNNEDNILPCSEKLAFDSKKAADASAVAIKYQRGTKLKAYKCQYCGLWHLASDYSK